MPPWSGDYHFNINVQECYAPADQGNRLAHLRPLFDMIWSWRAQLRENARLFVGIEDGLMLPHGVDDRGMNMGGFWTGTVDHGCTAWVAKMMFDYWRFGGEKKFLKTVAFPFMVGALRVYEVMLERTGDRFILPVSVSPEYRGASFNTWGRNASFQLACIHWLLEIWQRVFTNAGHGTLHDYEFPGFTVMGAPGKKEIMQLDAGLAAAAAILDSLVHVRRGVHHLFAGLPPSRGCVRFQGVRTEGAFLVSAERCGADVRRVSVLSEQGGVFRLANPWGSGVLSCILSRGAQKNLSARKFFLPRPVVVAMLRAPKAKARAIGGCE